ncbi:MAG: phosphonate C-P lyase system protein PhnG [Rhodoferax sp.]|uniref:phosphonate C-P lyase system protein PhnG n=1 Tax=Rhodoferax sp. TaxID=50421 RepID=UPI00261C6FC7|nr:phosphonate C-P lyase system protein PhnG [Rhodoferax sp.]MDD2880801.1 phosphonate C-P lyase system protein PhnG [Rhodoferax sp.]
MTHHNLTSDYPTRPAWLAVLARATLAELEGMAPARSELSQLQSVRPPEIGMVMLRGRIGGTGNPFNLGEASVVRCALRLGDGPLGVSYALGRDKRRAELAALFDAMLQDPQHHDRLQRQVIAPLAVTQAQARGEKQQAVAASKVEFFTFVRGEA